MKQHIVRMVGVVVLFLSASTATAQKLLIQPDKSGSVDQKQLTEFVDEVLRLLRANAERITGVDVLPFASATEESWTATPTPFEWGPPPVLPAFDQRSVPQTLGSRIFAASNDRTLANARAAHDQQNQAKTTAFWAKVDRQLAAARERLLERPAKAALCTSFADLAVRSGQIVTPQLIITDGLVSCLEPPVEIPRSSHPIAVLLLPAVSDPVGASRAAAFARRSSALRRYFPTAVIAPAHNLASVTALVGGEAADGRTVIAPVQPPPRRGRPAAPNPPPAAGRTTSKPAGASDAEANVALTAVVHRAQRAHVPPSFGPYKGQCFDDDDFARFLVEDSPSKVAAQFRSHPETPALVGQMRALDPKTRSIVLARARRPLHKTWTELGGTPTPDGQTDAGVRAEILVANAIVDTLVELLRTPGR